MTLVASLDDNNSQSLLAEAGRRFKDARHGIFIHGAGVSTGAAIPDFRGASGLFAADEGGDVRELFHVKCLASTSLLPKHHALLNTLADMSAAASPTPYHRLLKKIEGQGRLLRCYSQNIDGLEGKAGLSTGLPAQRQPSPRKSVAGPSTPRKAPQIPHCIPLHGVLDTLHCNLCSTKYPLQEHLPLPPGPLVCPTCALDTSLRIALNERTRQAGQLRASVVFYGEEHPAGHLIGSVLERDLRKVSGADLLVVAGTSLVIPGVKRMVKEISKALRTRYSTKLRSIFINHDPPPAEFDGIFDLWIIGDVQRFVEKWVETQGDLPPTPRKTPKPKGVRVAKTAVTPITPKKSAMAVELGYLPTPGPTPPALKRQSSVLETPSKQPKRARAFSTSSDSSLTSIDD